MDVVYFIVAILAIPYGYAMCWCASHAYFEVKRKYHHNLIRDLERSSSQ